MSARVTDMSVRPAMAGKCACGRDCGGQCACESRCCELECLVRPNFFCGQLLTDTDLGAMVEWTRKRLALARYRDGWGVVCGLDITCSFPRGGRQFCSDAQNGPAVYVNPGYAIDCCGNDLVVCEPFKVDLSSVCQPPSDLCDPQPKPAPDPDSSATDQSAPKNCLELSRENLFAVQLNLRYHEDLAQGQRAMFRSGCSDVGPCEYSRVLERPCVHVEVVPLAESYDEESDEQEWVEEFRRRLLQELKEIRTLLVQGLDAVLQYLKRNPPYQFCFLEEVVCCLRARNAADQVSSEELSGVGMYLLLDWVLRQLQCPCLSCRPDNGVPLGKVLLRRTVVAGRTQCRVVMIDSSVPHRRPLHKDGCRPIAAGKLDLAPYLWQSLDSTQSRLRSLGVTMHKRDQDLKEGKGLESLENMVANQVFAVDPTAAGSLIAHTVTDVLGKERIAAFVFA
jgi:hypothetical protein